MHFWAFKYGFSQTFHQIFEILDQMPASIIISFFPEQGQLPHEVSSFRSFNVEYIS